ncbi:MAG: TIGR03086 family metal-binding protein [Nocardioidaceae bacterium]
MTDVLLEDLAESLDDCGRLVEAVAPCQWDAPTPCADWDVTGLVTHLIDGHRAFAAALGAAPSEAPEVDLADAYRTTGEAMLTAFRGTGALGRPVTVGIGTVPGAVALQLRVVEALVHGWDLAQATGQEPRFRDDLAERALRFTEGALPAIPTGHRPFGPPQQVSAEAPALDRLVGLLGRRLGS